MAIVKFKSEGKSGFLKEFFVDDPDAGKDTINKAWREAGNAGTISDSLIYLVRTKLGLTGKGRAKAETKQTVATGKRSSTAPWFQSRETGTDGEGRAAANVAQPAGPRVVGERRTTVLIDLEGRIDDLLHEARAAGGPPMFEETLRKARRILARSHQE